jgi:hypothetical protein
MMKDYRIQRLQQLAKKKKALESAQEPTEAATERAPSDDIPEPETVEKPPTKRPETLKGMTFNQMELLFTDGLMTEVEENWFKNRSRPPRVFHGADGWMTW